MNWDDLAESIRVYALGDVKHGYLIWICVLGCLLRDLFPDPESVLYLTGLNQAEFVQGFSGFILESLVGTEPHPAAVSRARTREELLCSLRYRRSSGALSERPPARVELLEEMLSPWASVTYGGCRYLRVARAETIRKLRAVNTYYKVHKEEELGSSVLDVEISPGQVDYVLFYLTMEDCMFQPRSTVKAIPLRGWANQPDHPHPIPDLRAGSSLENWLSWADLYGRGVRASTMEWLIMDPSRGKAFTEKLCSSPSFRAKFGGLYAFVTSALARLGATDLHAPASSGTRSPRHELLWRTRRDY